MDISSLGITYQYVVKIEKKFQLKDKREFGSTNYPQQKDGKCIPNW